MSFLLNIIDLEMNDEKKIKLNQQVYCVTVSEWRILYKSKIKKKVRKKGKKNPF